MENLVITGCRRHRGRMCLRAGSRGLTRRGRTRMEVIIDERELAPVVMTEVNRDRGMIVHSAFQNSWC